MPAAAAYPHHMYHHHQPAAAAALMAATAGPFPGAPCVRYTTVPLPHPTAVFSLMGGGGGGLSGHDPGKSAIYCPAPLEASLVYTLIKKKRKLS